MPRPEQPVDPQDGPLQHFAFDLRKLREKAGNPGYRELGRDAHYSATTLAEAARGTKLPSLAVTVAYVRACGGDEEEWTGRWRTLSDELRGAVESDVLDPPYAGLAPLREADADRFFGRDRLIARLTDKLAWHRLVAVVGASGSGKSSLLRAGLLPAVRRDGRASLLITPGENPLEECAVRLAARLGQTPARLVAEFAEHPRNLGLCTAQLAGEAEGDEFVLVVDQFEEVFTLCHDEQQREAFVAALIAAADSATSRTRVVLGLRADFYGHCSRHPRLAQALEEGQVLVGPMTTDELRDVITKPAAGTGSTLETALVARLIADATGQPGVLPLLSHALLETWRTRRGTTMTLNSYIEAGGIDRAVANTAESVYSGLDAERQQLVRKIFLRLTALGEGTEDTKRRVRRDELVVDDAVVLDELTRARLLVVDDSGIEISHEALIRSWPRLRSWLADDREGLRVHRRLTDASAAWEALHRDPGSLYRGTSLSLAREWVERGGDALSPRERAFFDASVEAELREQAAVRRRTTRLRQLVALLSVLLLVATTATVFAVVSQRQAAAQRVTTLAQKAVVDAANLEVTNPALAAQLRLAAYRLTPLPEARDAVLGTFATPLSRRITKHTETTTAALYSPDGKILATASRDNTIRLWQDFEELAVLEGHSDAVHHMMFSPDGRMIASAGWDETVRLWDVSDPRHPRVLTVNRAHTDDVEAAVFSPDGRMLATSSTDRTVRLWTVPDMSPVHTFTGHTSNVHGLAYSPDGKTIASAGWDKVVRLWDVASRQQVGVLPHEDEVQAVEFSPDGTILATGTEQASKLWNFADRRELATMLGHKENVHDLGFSPDGRTLVTASADKSARLWDVSAPEAPRELYVFEGHQDGLWSAEFSRDGTKILTTSDDRTVRIEDLRGLPVTWHTDGVGEMAMDPRGGAIVTGDQDGGVRRWDMSGPPHSHGRMVTTGTSAVENVAFGPQNELAVLFADGTLKMGDRSVRVHEGGAVSMAFSSDGRLLATAGVDRTVKLWDVAELRELAVLDGHSAELAQVAFTGDDRTLMIGTQSPATHLWDVGDPRKPQRLPDLNGHTDVAYEVDTSRSIGATASADNSTVLWDLSDPRRPRQLSRLTGHAGPVQRVAFSPDGRMLATGSSDRTVRLWDVSDPLDPKQLATLTGAGDSVWQVAFTPDGRTVAATGADRTVRLWDVDLERTAERICADAQPRITEAEWALHFPGLDYQSPCGA